jgi:hypothetical protein
MREWTPSDRTSSVSFEANESMLPAMSSSRPRFRICIGIFCSLVVAASAASWPQRQAAETSTVVTVDFRAFTGDGTPVRDLRQEEVTLKVGRRTRDIVAMQLVQVPTSVQKQAAASQAPEPYVTNATAGGGGRDVVIVLDDEGVQPSRAKGVATMLTNLVNALSPADRVSLVVPGNPKANVELTASRASVLDAIGNLTGRAAAPRSQTLAATEEEAEMLCRTRRNLYGLLSVFENTAPSVPTVVVFISNGFSPPTTVESVSRRGQGPEGACEILPKDLEDLNSAAVASHAHVYGIEVVDDSVSIVSRTGDLSGGFEHVAGLSGNPVIRWTGGELPSLDRIAKETATYYVAAFEVAPDEQNGSSQKVEISVSRPDTVVRAIPYVVMPRAAGRNPAAGSPKLRDVLAAPRVYRDVPLRASAYTSRMSADGKLKIVCIFETAQSGIQLAEAGVVAFDDKGAGRAQWTGQKNALKGRPIVVPLNAPPPGTYRLRVAAKEASGAVGTLDLHVTVPEQDKNTVSLGSVVLGREGRGFSPLLQFTSEPVALGMVEIYNAPKTATVAAVFELAASETGPALATLPGSVESIRDDLRIATMTFPIKGMGPGDVVVRALVAVDGKRIDAKPMRTLRKVGQ